MHVAQRAGYVSYSEADYEVFALQGRHVAPMGGEIRSPPPRQISPDRCNDKDIGPPKLKFLLRFDQNAEYKRPAGVYPLRDFHKICRVCTPFQVR